MLSVWGADQAMSFADAKAKALREHKIVYLLVSTPNCSWCKQFKLKTLSDKAVQERLRGMAVTLQRDRGGDYPQTLEASRVPMHYFLAPDETVLVKIPGYWNIEDFMSILDDAERKRK